MSKKSLDIRNASYKDINGIYELVNKVYIEIGGYSKQTIRGQISNFAQGCFVILLNDTIVAYSASIRIDEEKALSPHTWKQITANGFGSTHKKDGEYLYGYETCVDPDVRGHRLGQRIYSARKELVKFENLKGIVFGGRIPGLHKKIKKVKFLLSI